MITVTEYAQQKVGVFGLGKAGEATLLSLLAGGAEIYASDDSEASCAKTAQTFTGKVNVMPPAQWPWGELKALVLSPGVPLTHPAPPEVVMLAREHHCPIVGDIELLYNACPKATYVGITGTNGKSTTTTLIGHIFTSAGCKVEIGGNLGTAALSLNPLGADGTYILELSSYQLDLVHTTRFNVAAFLNITPDHLDRHGSMEGYVAAKRHMFDRQQDNDTAVIATDDGYTRGVVGDLSRSGRQHITQVSGHGPVKGAGVYVEQGILHDALENPARSFDLRSIVTLTGAHNWQNAAVAYATARACGIAPEVIYAAMQTFAGLRHRLQLVATINGVRFINDSKATNADATSNALAPYDTIYWIAGGKPKAGGITSLEAYFPHIAHAYLIGAAEEEFAQTLEGKVRYTRCKIMQAALRQAAQQAFTDGKKGAVVLLSPACASFDQWKSFEERGDAFCTIVEDMEKSAKGSKSHAV